VPTRHTITFETNGGSAIQPQTVAKDDKAVQPAAPGKTGYVFSGWHSDSGLATAYNFDIPVVADITLYAQWTAITYTVVYDVNSGSGTTESSLHTYDVEKALAANGFSRTGYDFAGWNIAADGSGTSYNNNQSITNLSSTGGATVTLYAQWIPGASVEITLQPAPVDPPLSNTTIFKDEQIQFSVETGHTSYQWRWDSDIINGATGNTYTLTPNSKTSGVYELSVEVTTGGGTKLSARCRVTINDK
jgi:uncharacterized repeat protein (TIGR02543 family)